MEQSGRTSQFADHRRQWRDCLYVYPVIARRSKGLSIGVNLNPDKRCNYSCVYCQVDRSVPRGLHEVSLLVLRDELKLALGQAKGGQLWRDERFASTPAALRRINDIAFSGDGEPTCVADFDLAVSAAAKVKHEMGADDVKLVVITNSSNLASPQVRRALPILDANGGEIWAKLDAGTEEYFRVVNRPRGDVTLDQIVRDITALAVGRPVVIQSLFMNLRGAGPTPEEIAAYCGRINSIQAAGGRIKLIQAHTVARAPAEQYVRPLSDAQLEEIAAAIRLAAPGVNVEVFGGAMPGVTR